MGASLSPLAKSIYYIKCKEHSIYCTSALMFVLSILRACLHGGGGPQVGGVIRLSIWSRILIWSCLHDRWGDPPRRVARSTRPCYTLSQGLIHDTSNSRKIHFGGGFASLLEETRESHNTESCSKSSKWVLKSINRQNTWFASIFLAYLLSDHSIILRKCTPGWRVVRLYLKEGYCFTPPKRVTSPTWGPPPPCKQALRLSGNGIELQTVWWKC